MIKFLPDDVIRKVARGTGNMATITDGNVPRCRWPLGGNVLVFAHVHFVSGSGTATLKLIQQSRANLDAAFDRWTATARGVGADFSFDVPYELLHLYGFRGDDDLVMTWTDPGTIVWEVEIGYVPFVKCRI